MCWARRDARATPRSDRRHSCSTKELGACTNKDATRATLLTAGRLSPVEGGRTLALWGGALVELCGDRARQLARAFPFDRIDAVDSTGRPLVLHERTLFRWSPAHGWRRLFVAPDLPSD
ncbi:MAG TPA: hypothetical protein VM513_36750 [Kofleriaceae bacterium]|jgi:hypothetical protein|nr:hypothetical protein [Kofleriaceae bacterium]